jgi:MinD-like ATPase involved in chromosome partitioning or flagellar assembly
MVTFNQVLPTLVRICEAAPGMVELARCCAVRDLGGRVRLIVDPAPGAASTLDISALCKALEVELRSYFVGPVWSTAAMSNEAKFARKVFDQADPWSDATYDDPTTGNPQVLSKAPWRKLERRLSKQVWLESDDAGPPWKLGEGPSIVTFYSFKGGVGRTTALAACAWQLARSGKRVVILDLDLEAPGIGTLLGAETERGIVDFLVDYLATGGGDIDDLVANADALGGDKDRVAVLPAGVLDLRYLEKLGRLDFLGSDPQGTAQGSPVELALRELLFRARKLRPDYILIDSRAGLHDLAGLSLHRLAHVDVLVSRASEQGYRGLDLTVGALAQRKDLEQLQCILVHTMAPTPGTVEAEIEEKDFRSRSYAMFRKYIYLKQAGATIIEEDPSAPHIPIVVRNDPDLARSTPLQAIELSYFKPGFAALRAQIEEMCKVGGAAE